MFFLIVARLEEAKFEECPPGSTIAGLQSHTESGAQRRYVVALVAVLMHTPNTYIPFSIKCKDQSQGNIISYLSLIK